MDVPWRLPSSLPAASVFTAPQSHALMSGMGGMDVDSQDVAPVAVSSAAAGSGMDLDSSGVASVVGLVDVAPNNPN
jgi:hypothetical protein